MMTTHNWCTLYTTVKKVNILSKLYYFSGSRLGKLTTGNKYSNVFFFLLFFVFFITFIMKLEYIKNVFCNGFFNYKNKQFDLHFNTNKKRFFFHIWLKIKFSNALKMYSFLTFVRICKQLETFSCIHCEV